MQNSIKNFKLKYDWILFFIIAIICFVCFQQSDILHTGGSSFAYLNGHIFDFYDYNVQYMTANNYLPSTYILFAIWNIPIRLLGLVVEPTLAVGLSVVLWYKLLPTLFYFGSGMVFYQILLQLGTTRKKAELGVFIFLSSPIGFFSQFLFGQYDSFTLFFVLCGVYFWIKNDFWKFIIFFGVGITFKYTALLIFVPLLLLREKRYFRIIKACLLAIFPFALEVIAYIPSEAFRNGVFGFKAVGYITGLQFSTTYFQISPIIVLWLLLCSFAFLHNPENKIDEYKWGVWLSSLVCFLIFGLCQWHPQWLLFMIPFLVLGMLYHEKVEAFLILDLLLMGAFVLVTVAMWPNHVDQNLMGLGIFKNIIAQKGGFTVNMSSLLHAPALIYSFSAFSGLLLIATLFKHPRHLLSEMSDKITECIGLIRLRFIGGIAMFIIPAMICFGILIAQPDLIIAQGNMSKTVGIMDDTSDVRQYFSTTDAKVSEIKVAVGTYMQENHGNLTVGLYEADSDNLIAESKADISRFKDNSYCAIDLSDTELDATKQYYLKFTLERDSNADLLTIYRTSDQTANNNNYAMIDGVVADFNLCVNLYGERI